MDGRNLFEEPTQPCLGVVSDSDSDTDIEVAGMEAETQAIQSAAETQPVKTRGKAVKAKLKAKFGSGVN